MPDLSQDDIHANAPLAVASERQIWNNLSPEGRAQLLGQSIAGESNISNKESVYQKDPKSRSYESMDYSSLPQSVQYDVSHLLHEMGYFKETYGATVYEVDGDNRFECKDCEEPFVSEEDLRVHRKINHEDNGESETESQEAYNYSLKIDPSMTKDNLLEARKIIRGESSRAEYPQNEPKGPVGDPPLPKGRREYDNNPNHYFYDNKLFKRGSRGGNYDQTGVALTEARSLIQLEEKILNKYGWESTKEVEKDEASRQVFATEVAKVVRVESLHPRTIKIIDSVNKPFLVNTLTSLGAKWAKEDHSPSDMTDPSDTPIGDIPYRGDVHDGASTQDVDPFSQFEEPVLHQDYNPEHPHEHNAFDQNFGDKVAEEDVDDDDAFWKAREPYDKKPSYKGYSEEEEYKPSEEPIGGDIENDQKTIGLPKDKRSYDVEEEETEYKGFEPENELKDAKSQMKSEKKNPYEEYEWQKGQENQKDVTRTCATCGFYSASEQELGSHKRSHATENDEDLISQTFYTPYEMRSQYNMDTGDTDAWSHSRCKVCGNDDFVYDYDKPEMIEHAKSHGASESRASDLRKQIKDKTNFINMASFENPLNMGDDQAQLEALKDELESLGGEELESTEDFPFEEDVTTVTEEPSELLDNVNTDVLQVEGEQYDPEEKYDKKTDEARTISNYVGATQTKAGESIQNILEGAIDVPIERESVNEAIYNRKLEGYHEDKIARELAINHNIEYAEAIEKIRSIEVKDSDRTAKTLYGKKFADCNESEISEMKILGGEVKKSSMGKKNDRR